VDKEQLFYLSSRGIDGDVAQKAIISGFLGALVGRVKDQGIREKLLLLI